MFKIEFLIKRVHFSFEFLLIFHERYHRGGSGGRLHLRVKRKNASDGLILISVLKNIVHLSLRITDHLFWETLETC